MITRGRFITLEGGEAVGKSTNLQTIAEFLKSQAVVCVISHEPGGTPLAEDLRHFLLKIQDEKIAPQAELLLMFAARAQHIHEVIEPALSAGKWVICSRFTDSSYAYQGGGRGMPIEDIALLEHLVQPALQPDLTILLDLPVEIACERAQKRGLLDRIEQEDRNFFKRVRTAYLARAGQYPERFRVVDAAQPLNIVQRVVIDHIKTCLAVP